MRGIVFLGIYQSYCQGYSLSRVEVLVSYLRLTIGALTVLRRESCIVPLLLGLAPSEGL